MKNTVVIGILLVILGGFAMTYDRITYKKQEKIIDVGPIHATVEREKSIPLPLVFGGLVVIAGIVLIFLKQVQK